MAVAQPAGSLAAGQQEEVGPAFGPDAGENAGVVASPDVARRFGFRVAELLVGGGAERSGGLARVDLQLRRHPG